ncbi:transposase [Streptomyces sp. NPDC059447]|uniref:transposase n=1 Tax=Streptomyces sp. NPDC059447 TaxID=3346834 RepID=UPI00368A1303
MPAQASTAPRSPSTGTSGRPPAHAGTPAPGGAPATLRGTKAIVIKFDEETCRPCPVRDQCTRSKTGGRTLSLQPREGQEVFDHARLQQDDEQRRAKYGTRAGIEATIHQAVAVTGMRHARYLGLQKTHLEHVSSASTPGGTATRRPHPCQPSRPTRPAGLQPHRLITGLLAERLRQMRFTGLLVDTQTTGVEADLSMQRRAHQ